ncbi:hydroxyacid dehydrogenase [Tropicibacter sp. S64]|uniref:hydroxyacid dehydrogenase n=1 Tax=Tropicibacter sp. S64 TaxID=3415122 RepID=UPI003C7A4CC1
MYRVLVAGMLHPSGRALLDDCKGIEPTYVDDISEESYAPLIGEADALLIRTQPMSAATVARAKRLRLVSRHGVGYDAVDVAALTAQGIPLAVCGDVNSTSVAEHAMMMILAATKRVLRADAAVRKGPWAWRNRLESQDLRGRNLLLLGYGRIGRHTAVMAAGFGLHIRAYDPYLLKQGWPEGPVTPASNLRDALAWADVISVSAPRADKPLIGPEEFAAMKPGTVLVNTARGGIVDEAALVEALKDGTIGAAGLDVFEQEPLPADHPLKSFDQVLLSPHIAGVTAGAAERMAIGSAQNVIDFFHGRLDPALIVNRTHLHDYKA